MIYYVKDIKENDLLSVALTHFTVLHFSLYLLYLVICIYIHENRFFKINLKCNQTIRYRRD